jgi:hypothetical protein
MGLLFDHRLPKEFAPVVSFTVFATMLILGVNLQARPEQSTAFKFQDGLPAVRR